MARAIDAEKCMELLKEQYLHHKSLGNSQAEKAWQGAIQLLYDMPTLTPPNEALTIEQLREMDGEPVWLDVAGGVWALVDTDDNLVWLDRGGSIDIYKLIGKVYRRPPEGNP